jgi:hypothetical protein
MGSLRITPIVPRALGTSRQPFLQITQNALKVRMHDKTMKTTMNQVYDDSCKSRKSS